MPVLNVIASETKQSVSNYKHKAMDCFSRSSFAMTLRIGSSYAPSLSYTQVLVFNFAYEAKQIRRTATNFIIQNSVFDIRYLFQDKTRCKPFLFTSRLLSKFLLAFFNLIPLHKIPIHPAIHLLD